MYAKTDPSYEPINCIFCKIIDGKVPSMFIDKTDDLVVIRDIAPQADYHYLIIPRAHLIDANSLDDSNMYLSQKIFEMAKKLALDVPNNSYKMVINNGFLAGQRVWHLHAHFLAGKIDYANIG